MSQIKVLIDGNETMILESKLRYFQEVLGAELVIEEVKQVKQNKKQNKSKK